jgi:phospholipid transport system substrate-binding protein
MSKYWISFLKIIIITGFFSFSANAGNEENVRNFVQNTIDKILGIIRQDMSENKKQALLENEFLRVVDTDWIAKYTLGRHWKNLSPSQTKEFLSLYKKYLINMYVPNFKNYNSDLVKVISIGKMSPNEYVVKTVIYNERETTNFSVDFWVIDKKDKIQIFDIITEGVSMSSTQRSEFNAIISSNSIEYLFEKLRKNEFN